MVIYSGFTHKKWPFSIAMLVYQRVYTLTYCKFIAVPHFFPVPSSRGCIDHGRSVVKVVPFLRQTRSVSRSEICSSLGELVSPGTVAGDHPDANSRMTKYRTIKGSSPFIPFPLRCQLQSRHSLLILFEMHFSTLKALK